MSTYVLHSTKSWSGTQQDLSICFDLWGIKEWQTDYPKGARFEGFQQSEQDRTVTLTYVKNGKTVRLTMGKQRRAVDNLRVLYLAVDAIRLNEKRGIGDIIAEAYLQLAAPEQAFDPYQTLGLPRGLSASVYETQFRELSKKAHPDAGGSQEQFELLNRAIEEIRKGVK